MWTFGLFVAFQEGAGHHHAFQHILDCSRVCQVTQKKHGRFYHKGTNNSYNLYSSCSNSMVKTRKLHYRFPHIHSSKYTLVSAIGQGKCLCLGQGKCLCLGQGKCLCPNHSVWVFIHLSVLYDKGNVCA